MWSGFVEALNESTAIRLDHALGCHVDDVGGQLDCDSPSARALREQQLQRARRVAAAPLPRHHRISGVPQTICGKFGRARLPPEAN